MTHLRLIPLRGRSHAPTEAAARLRERIEAAGPVVEQLLWVPTSGDGSMLVLECIDALGLARVLETVVEPWLEASGLEAATPVTEGEVALAYRRGAGVEDLALDHLSDEDRVAAFIDEVARTETVWGLYGDTWARSSAAGEVEALPLWSERRQAARCVDGGWRSFVPRPIELDAFLDQWLTGMHEDGIVAVLLPTPVGTGTIVDPSELADALRGARERSVRPR